MEPSQSTYFYDFSLTSLFMRRAVFIRAPSRDGMADEGPDSETYMSSSLPCFS